MGNQVVRSVDESSRFGLSPAIFEGNRIPDHSEFLDNPALGRSVLLNFMNGTPKFATTVSQNGMVTYQDTGVTIQGSAVVDAGLEIAGNDADNDEGSITLDGGTGASFVISDTAGVAKKLAFEAVFSKASVADDGLAFFLGLAEEGLAAADTLVDNTGEVASKDLIGFHCLQDDGDSLDIIYRKAGQAKQAVSDAHQAIAASTYYSLGMVYDPAATAAEKIKFYINGVEQGVYVSATNIAAATFPDGEELTFLLATKVGSAAEVKANLRLLRIAQLR